MPTPINTIMRPSRPPPSGSSVNYMRMMALMVALVFALTVYSLSKASTRQPASVQHLCFLWGLPAVCTSMLTRYLASRVTQGNLFPSGGLPLDDPSRIGGGMLFL